MFWLNADAPANMEAMLVTDPTFHKEISSLNVVFPSKRWDMSVIKDVHQVPIGQPHVSLRLIHDCEEVFTVHSLLMYVSMAF